MERGVYDGTRAKALYVRESEREREKDPLGVKLEDRVCADNVFGTMEKRD